MAKAPAPWTYRPEGDSDGFTIGTDHFVLDANGDEVCVAPDEATGMKIAAVNDLIDALKRLLSVYVDVVQPTCPFSEAATVEMEVREALRKAGVK